MAKKLRVLYFWVVSFCAAIIFCSTVYLAFMVGPAVETRWFPPVSKLTITALHENQDGFAVVEAQFEKYRDCDYLGIAWYIRETDGTFERVPVQLLRKEGDTSSPNRPTGIQRAGPWIIGMTTEQLTNQSFAELKHQCWPLWVTTTEFYP